MDLNLLTRSRRYAYFYPPKLMCIMTLTAFLLIIVGLKVKAEAVSQKISISEQNASLEKVFKVIRKKSGYLFIYNNESLRKAKPVTIQFHEAPLEQVLDKCFQGQPLAYSFLEKTIVVKTKEVLINNEKTTVELEIKGKVVDENGGALPGVTVALKGTAIGTITDSDGNYTLRVPENNGTLVFSFIGYTIKEAAINGQTVINLSLSPDARSLDEVVVAGYGTQKKSELTGAVASIKSDDLQKVATSSFTSAIQGKVPGVYISQTSGAPGGASSVRIRGVGTTGGNQPLYVIDGLPVSGGGMSIAGSSDRIDILSIINPNDIESIEVLKDAAAASIYGARAANGVILVTTKRGKEGQAKVNVDAYTGVQQLWRRPELLNAEEFATLANELYNNSGLTPNPEWANPAALGEGTDWIDQIFRTAPVQNYDFRVSGGSQKLTGALSLGYRDQQGTLIETWYKRYTGRITSDLKVNDKIRFGSSLAFALSQAKGQRNQDMGLGIVNLAQQYYPTLGPYEVANGSTTYYNTSGDNPLLRAQTLDNRLRDLRMYGNIFGELEIIPGLKWRTNVGIDVNNNRTTTWAPKVERGLYRNLQATLGENYS